MPSDAQALSARTSVRTLLSPTPKDAAAQRHEMRRVAARVMRAYKTAQPIAPTDAAALAVSVAQFITAIELGLRDGRKHGK